MTQDKEISRLKRIKSLYQIFLKNFQLDEYKLLMQFLQLSINKYNSSPDLLIVQDEKSNDSEQKNSSTRKNSVPNKRASKIEQTINMLKSRNENISDVDLDDEELNLIEVINEYNNECITDNRENINDIDSYNNFDENNFCDENYITDEQCIKNENDEDIEEIDEESFNYNSESFSYNDDSITYNNKMLKVSNYNLPPCEVSTPKFKENASKYYEYAKNDCQNSVFYQTENYPRNTGQSELNPTLSSFIKTIKIDIRPPVSNFIAIQPKGGVIPPPIHPINIVNTPTKKENSTPKSTPNGTPNGPRKFIRKFDDDVRCELELKFLENNFISGVEKDQLAIRCNLTERQVKKWFEKRREKKRRLEKMNSDYVSPGIGRPANPNSLNQQKGNTPKQGGGGGAYKRKKFLSEIITESAPQLTDNEPTNRFKINEYLQNVVQANSNRANSNEEIDDYMMDVTGDFKCDIILGDGDEEIDLNDEKGGAVYYDDQNLYKNNQNANFTELFQ